MASKISPNILPHGGYITGMMLGRFGAKKRISLCRTICRGLLQALVHPQWELPIFIQGSLEGQPDDAKRGFCCACPGLHVFAHNFAMILTAPYLSGSLTERDLVNWSLCPKDSFPREMSLPEIPSSEGEPTASVLKRLWEGANSDWVKLVHHPFVSDMLTQTLPLSGAATYINDQVQYFTDFLSPLRSDPEGHPTVKAENYVGDLRNAVTNLELERKNLAEGVSSVAFSGRSSPVAQKMKQLIDAKSEYENSGDALLSWTAILRLRDLLAKTITSRLPQPNSGNSSDGVRLSTFAKSQFQGCIALVEEELMRILPATMNEVETERVKNVFNAVLQFESALLDSAYARTQPNVELTQQSSSAWHPSNIIFTTDFDVTCTIVDSCDSLVRAAESAAKKSSGDFRPGKLVEDYDAVLDRHAIRTKITLQSLENPESGEITKRLSGRDETSEDVVPGMDPSLKPWFDNIIKTSAVSSSEDSGVVPFDEAGLRRGLSKLSDLEILCNKDIMSSGVLSGFTREGVLAEAKLVELRPNCARVLKKLVEIETQIHVVSANWSRDLIIGGLPSTPEGKLFVHCNDMLYDSFGISTGFVDNTVVDAFDKEQMLRALRTLYSHHDGKIADLQVAAQADGKAIRMLVYLGDSHTDLLGLLEADLGIVISASLAARKVMSLYGIKLLPLVEASASISEARLNGSQCSWRRSGILFEAQGWEDVQACLFGAAEIPGSTDPLESSEQRSEDPSVQQPQCDTADMSQERPPPANLELVQVAC